MFLQAVFLSLQELIDLDQVRGVHGLALWLRAMVHVILVAQILVTIVHVRAGINIEVLLRWVLNLNQIMRDCILILAKEGSQYWEMLPAPILTHKALVNPGDAEATEELIANGQPSECRREPNCLEAKIKAEGVRDTLVPIHLVVEVRHRHAVFDRDVVRKEEHRLAIEITELVVPVHVVVFDPPLSEPGTSGYFGDSTKVAHRIKVVEHHILL